MTTRAHVTIEDGIARIDLDDGKVNAMSATLLREIGAGLDAAEKENAVVVLRGREGIFSAGFDLPTFARGLEASLEMVSEGVRVIERLLGFPRPILTVCTGHAYPMGAFLMLSADRRLGIEGPWRIGMNEVAIGITVPGFAVELARHRLSPAGVTGILAASMFDPQEARRLGYLDRVVSADELDRAVEEEAVRLRELDPTHFAATKARINERVLAAVRRAADEDMRTLSSS